MHPQKWLFPSAFRVRGLLLQRLGLEAIRPVAGFLALIVAQGIDEGVEVDIGPAGVAGQHVPLRRLDRIGRDERYARVYNIDDGRCIFCGFCVEACPKDAITHGYNFELSVYSRADLLKTKDDLLITKQIQSKNYRVALSGEDVDSEFKEV